MPVRRTVAAGRPAGLAESRAPSSARLGSSAASWRTNLIVAALGIAASVAVVAYATSASSTVAKLNDFYRESWPAYDALAHGHLVGFLGLGPAYVGSLVLRAPFALIPTAWGAGPTAVYFASALPCMFAVAAFCTWLAAQPRKRGGIGWASRINPIVCCIFNPLVLVALFGGHPEEVLGAVLCVFAVVLAAKGRIGWAGVVTGLAVANKSWALVAVPVVFVAMPADRRRGLIVIAATAAAVLVPVLLAGGQSVNASAASAQIGGIFNPPQLLWWLGPHQWVVREARAAIVLVAVVCAVLWWLRRARARPPRAEMVDVLLLLALVLLVRAALDPWNNLYYHVPFLFALIAWEVRSGRIPLLTFVYTVALLIVVPVHGIPSMSGDLRAAAYAAVVLPTFAWLAARLYWADGAWKRLVLAAAK